MRTLCRTVLFLGAAGLAQAAERPVQMGEEVVVTATRFRDRYVDTPVNMTVITAEDIRASSAKTVPDILAEQAGISIHDFFGNNAATTTIGLRGFGITGGQNTLILLDGRRVSDIDLSGVQWSAMPLNAVERIEILRGSGAVLYGEGATAGVINIITRSPARIDNSVAVLGRVASYDTREAGLYANYFKASFGINLIASNFESDGYRDNNRNRQGNLQTEFRAITGAGDISLKLANDNQGIRLPGARLVHPSAGVNELATDRRGAQTPLDWAQRVGNRATLDWRHETPVGEFNLGIGYRDKEQTSYFDRGGPFSDYRITELGVWSVSPRMRFPQPVFGVPNTLVAGVDWYRWDYRLRASNSPSNIGRPFSTVDATQENTALYLHNTTRLTPRLTLVAGARAERYRIAATDLFDPAAPGGFSPGAPAGSRNETERAWELALRYQFLPEWSMTGKLGRSYRFATVDEIYEFGGPPLFAREFQFLRPQKAVFAEVGVERRFASGFLRTAFYVMDVTDEIHLDTFSAGIGNTNLPPSRRRGLEIEGWHAFSKQLRVGAAYTLTEAKFREGALPGDPFTTVNVVVAGKTVPLVPRHKFNLNASWAITTRTRLNALFSYVSSQYMDNDEGNTGIKIPSYAVFNMKLIHQERGWRLTAGINNLFNQKYYNYAVRSADQLTPDRYNAYPLPERNFTAMAEYTFR